jgi:hypothetical protein
LVFPGGADFGVPQLLTAALASGCSNA